MATCSCALAAPCLATLAAPHHTLARPSATRRVTHVALIDGRVLALVRPLCRSRRNSKEFIDSFSGAQKAERQRRNSRDSKESIGGAPAAAEAGPGK
jgi:hypothetical protein